MTRTLNLLAFVIFSGSLFFRAFDPIIPQIADSFGTTPERAALLTTAFSLPYALIQPVLGALGDMFNKVRLMLICLAALAASSLAGVLVHDFELLVVTRLVAGLAAGGLVPIAFAVVGDLVPIEGRQVALGRILFAIMMGNLLGATGAGVIADLLGWRAVFVATAALAFLILGIAARALSGVGGGGQGFDLGSLGPNYRAIFGNPLAKVCFSAVIVEAVFMYGVFPHMASLLRASGETRASIAGVVIGGFGIGGILYSLRVAFLLRTFGERRMMRIGGCIMGACIASLALRASWPVDFVSFCFLGLGFFMLHGVIQIYASELAPKARASALSLHAFFYFLGQAAGPAVYNLGFTTIGTTAILVLGGVCLALTGLACSNFLRR
jgi:predicted MFS family arabinose efflux permease